ncbi:MAG: ferredoxin family protein [Methanobacteriota archaeon]|nr:MAG: ferredoxin family protein [Euryarchaeota archaeon]
MRPEINLKHCKACDICVYMCPNDCFSRGVDISDRGYFAAVVSAPEKCFNHGRTKKLICELCVLSCPDQAISWKDESTGDEGSGNEHQTG